MKKVIGFILTLVCCSTLLFGLFSFIQAEEQAAVAQSEMDEYTKDDYFYFDCDRDGVLDECQVQDYADSLHLEDIRQSDLFNSNCETIWKPSIERCDFILCIGFIGLTKYENIEKSRRSNVSENKTKPSKEGMFINTYITLPKPCRYAFKDVYHCVLLPLRNRRFSYNRKKRLNAHFDIISSIVYRGS